MNPEPREPSEQPGPRPESGPHLDAGALYDLMEGTIGEPEASAWRSHIASCERCRELERSLGPVAERLRRLAAFAEASLGGSLAGAIRERLAAEHETSPAPRPSARRIARSRPPVAGRHWGYLAAAAAVALGLGLALALAPARPGPRSAGSRLAQSSRSPTSAETAQPRDSHDGAAVRRQTAEIAREVQGVGTAAPAAAGPAGAPPLETAAPGLAESPPPSGEEARAEGPLASLGPVVGGADERGQDVRPGPGADSSEVHLARIEHIEGFVTYARGESGRWQPAREGMRILPGDRLNTGAGRLELALEDGGCILADQATVMRLVLAETGSGRTTLADVARGELCVDDSGGHVRAASPHGVFTPVGTLFNVKVSAAVTTLVVAEGSVEARARRDRADWLSSGDSRAEVDLRGIEWAGEAVRVEAGRSSSVGAGVPASAPARTDVERAFAWALGRAKRGLQALYLFREGSGNTVHDVSGTGAPLNLTIRDASAVSWLRGGGLLVRSPVVISSNGPASKITEACRASGALTIEALVLTRDASAESPVRIVSLSKDPYNRNFSLGVNGPGQPDSSYGVRLRTTVTTANGTLGTLQAPPVLSTAGGAVGAELAHVVFTRDANGATRLYVNGAELVRGKVGGSFANWDAEYPLVLANELTGGREWLGELRLVAIYSRSLQRREVWRNWRAGTVSLAERVHEPASTAD